MGDQKDQKDIKVSTGPIPEGWVLDTKIRDDGTEFQYYLCPPSTQHFYTYEDLMRYVRYAKAAKLSIYNPNFIPVNQEEDHVRLKKEGQSFTPKKEGQS